MANKYINVYMNNPTAGQTDGTQVSTDDTEGSPISVTLAAKDGAYQIVKCALRCESGFSTSGDIKLSFTGTNKAKWSLAADNSYADATAASAATFSDTLTISDAINTTNKIFWVKATASADEDPQDDKSVNLSITANIAAE